MRHAEKALGQLYKNWSSVGQDPERGIPPSTEHYPHNYYWDSCFIAIVASHFGDTDLAQMQINTTLSAVSENGFIPNIVFGKNENRRKIDPERLTFKNPSYASDYTQPPVIAHAAWTTYMQLENSGRGGRKFLETVYPKISNHYKYFAENRTNDNQSLIRVIHPHETGRDSDPTYDQIKGPTFVFDAKRHRRIDTPLAHINSVLGYLQAINLNRRLKSIDWDTKRAQDIFWTADVMMNCIYAENLDFMAKIAEALDKNGDSEVFKNLSGTVAAEILEQMMDRESGIFYSLDREGGHLKSLSVNNLFPIILDNLEKKDVESILSLIEDPDLFGTKYPIPSVPANHKRYDPSYREKRIWRGPVWINTNWYILRGLILQRDRFSDSDPDLAKRCNDQAKIIAEKTSEMVNTYGCWEFYHPDTGKGMRIDDFAWSTLGYLIAEMVDTDIFESKNRFGTQKEI